MRRKITSESENKSVKKVVLFCVVVILLIAVSSVLKLISILKESKYDSSTRFTIAVVEEKRTFRIFSFDPQTTTVASLIVKGKIGSESPQQIIGIPIDGTIILSHSFILPANPSDVLQTIIFHPTKVKSDITSIDLFRLLSFAKTVPAKNIQQEQLSLPNSQMHIDKLATQMFSDSRIINDNLSIEIVNGTNVSGMASRLERLIDNAGGNVVAVSSAHDIEKFSKIYYYRKSSYTARRLHRLLGYSLQEMDRQSISDIKIIIGEDQLNTTKF